MINAQVVGTQVVNIQAVGARVGNRFVLGAQVATGGRRFWACRKSGFACALLGIGGVALGFACLAFAEPAEPGLLARERQVERRVQEITGTLRCPTCQALSVRDSEAAFSQQMRAQVERMVREGQSTEQIQSFFVSRYGPWILRAPQRRGLGWLLWIAPPTLLLLGALGIALRWFQTRIPAEAPAPLSQSQRQHIAAHLRRYEEAQRTALDPGQA